MSMPTLSEGHRRLHELAGRWEGEETLFPSRWDATGGKATGRTHCRVALGGFAVLTDYEQERDGAISYAGHGVWTFDPRSEVYSLHWFDSLGSLPEVFTGGFEGRRLVVAHGGPGMHARLTYDLSEAGRLETVMELSPDGGSWKRLVEGRLQKR